ncbi:MAG: hypothetical protein LWX07_00985 [Bacteroidetes bacterium]|nr:hypothetical protein [Bacteroidota bacterium]
MKYFYLSYGEMSLKCLSELIEMNLKPALVVTHKSYEFENQKDKFYKKIEDACKTAGIEFVQTDKISELKDRFTGMDTGVSAGFMEIIKEDVYSLPKYGIINMHCGKLPEYRGRAPISRAMMDGQDTMYITVHKVDSGVDSGDILVEKPVIIDDEDDVNSLYYKCSFNCANILKEAFEKLDKGGDIYTKQDLSKKPKANLSITDEERSIDWNKSVKIIYDKIRALNLPYPGAFTEMKGKRYYMLRAKPFYTIDKPAGNGEITEANIDFILVKCSDGYVMVYDIRDVNMESFIYNEVFKKGDRFS